MIATSVKTDDFYRIVSSLVSKEGWKVLLKYEGGDAGLDFDFQILKKGNKKITVGWELLDEGEIKCSEDLMNELSEKFNIKFSHKKPSVLKFPYILFGFFPCSIDFKNLWFISQVRIWLNKNK